MECAKKASLAWLRKQLINVTLQSGRTFTTLEWKIIRTADNPLATFPHHDQHLVFSR
jgi:hypothetical protein